MHLVEQYALACGVKIDKPSVEVNFFPLPFESYIVIHPSSGMTAKNYDYFQDVVDLISPYLEKQNIKIVQIGLDKDPKLDKCHNLNGVTSLPQTFFLIKNCKLLLGNDSFSTHVASGFNKNIVSLYSNSLLECCGPYWGEKTKQSLIQATPEGVKPSLSPSESPKCVNNICSGHISREVLSLMSIKCPELKNFKTVFTGDSYKDKAVEIIPDFYSNLQIPGFPESVNIRLDYYKNITEINDFINFTKKWASKYVSHLIVKDPIDINIIRSFRNKIMRISIKLNDSFSLDYLNSLKSLGVNLSLFCENEENLGKFQLKFLDFGVERLPETSKKDLDLQEDICDNYFYKTNKLLVSKGKFYSSKENWNQNIEYSEESKVIDSPEFWKEAKYFKIYKK